MEEAAMHPLDPLTKTEIRTAVEVVRAQSGIDATAWFETVTLDEPDKAELAQAREGQRPARRIHVCCYEPSSNRTMRGICAS